MSKDENEPLALSSSGTANRDAEGKTLFLFILYFRSVNRTLIGTSDNGARIQSKKARDSLSPATPLPSLHRLRRTRDPSEILFPILSRRAASRRAG